ncbi:MAG TPA: hypothetical protein VFW98_18615 [Gemmatimonadaceae bacterium]|nr:hypothetical protein [Gemmatimonadaceae bacterium]
MADTVSAASSFRSWPRVHKWLSLRGWQQASIIAAVLWLVWDTSRAMLLSLPGGHVMFVASAFAMAVCLLRICHDILKYVLNAIVAKDTLDKLKRASPQQRQDYFDALYLQEVRKKLEEMPWRHLVYKQTSKTHADAK